MQEYIFLENVDSELSLVLSSHYSDAGVSHMLFLSLGDAPNSHWPLQCPVGAWGDHHSCADHWERWWSEELVCPFGWVKSWCLPFSDCMWTVLSLQMSLIQIWIWDQSKIKHVFCSVVECKKVWLWWAFVCFNPVGVNIISKSNFQAFACQWDMIWNWFQWFILFFHCFGCVLCSLLWPQIHFFSWKWKNQTEHPFVTECFCSFNSGGDPLWSSLVIVCHCHLGFDFSAAWFQNQKATLLVQFIMLKLPEWSISGGCSKLKFLCCICCLGPPSNLAHHHQFPFPQKVAFKFDICALVEDHRPTAREISGMGSQHPALLQWSPCTHACFQQWKVCTARSLCCLAKFHWQSHGDHTQNGLSGFGNLSWPNVISHQLLNAVTHKGLVGGAVTVQLTFCWAKSGLLLPGDGNVTMGKAIAVRIPKLCDSSLVPTGESTGVVISTVTMESARAISQNFSDPLSHEMQPFLHCLCIHLLESPQPLLDVAKSVELFASGEWPRFHCSTTNSWCNSVTCHLWESCTITVRGVCLWAGNSNPCFVVQDFWTGCPERVGMLCHFRAKLVPSMGRDCWMDKTLEKWMSHLQHSDWERKTFCCSSSKCQFQSLWIHWCTHEWGWLTLTHYDLLWQTINHNDSHMLTSVSDSLTLVTHSGSAITFIDVIFLCELCSTGSWVVVMCQRTTDRWDNALGPMAHLWSWSDIVITIFTCAHITLN